MTRLRVTNRPPRGHDVVDRETFDRITWPDYVIEVPGPEGGWATTRIGSTRFATWMAPLPGFRRAVEDVVGPVEWTESGA